MPLKALRLAIRLMACLQEAVPSVGAAANHIYALQQWLDGLK